MKKSAKKPMGRPSGGGENDALVHVRIPADLIEDLDVIRFRMGEDDETPTISAMIRKAIREYVKAHK